MPHWDLALGRLDGALETEIGPGIETDLGTDGASLVVRVAAAWAGSSGGRITVEVQARAAALGASGEVTRPQIGDDL